MWKQEFEWLTSNTRIAYPFVDQVTSPATFDGFLFSDLVVDAFLNYDNRTKEEAIQLTYIEDPRNSNPKITFSFEDSSDAFKYTAAAGQTYQSQSFGDYLIGEWVTDTGVARMTFLESRLGEFPWPTLISGAYLVPHTLQIKPGRVTSLKYRDEFDVLQDMQPNVAIYGGYNADVANTTNPNPTAGTDVRGRKFIQLDLSAGRGDGTYTDCDESPAVYTINGVGPDPKGNFTLRGEDCYRIEIPMAGSASGALQARARADLAFGAGAYNTSLEALLTGTSGWPKTLPPFWTIPNMLVLRNSCEPCCDCEDYVYMYNVLLRDTVTQGNTAAQKLYQARDDYDDFVAYWDDLATKRKGVKLQVQVVGRNGWTSTVQVRIRNNTSQAVTKVNFTVGLTGPTRGALVSGSGIATGDNPCGRNKPFNITGNYPTFHGEYKDTEINPGTAATIIFQVYYPIKKAEDDPDVPLDPNRTNGYAIKASASATAYFCDGTSTTVTGNGSGRLVGPFNKENG